MAKKNPLTQNTHLNLPFVIKSLGGQGTRKTVEAEYLRLDGGKDINSYGPPNKSGKPALKVSLSDSFWWLKKKGILVNPAKATYAVAEGFAIPSEFTPYLNSTPVVEDEKTPVVEETPVSDPVVVEVKNPAVVDAYIDTNTNELVENVGGSRDFRKPLDQVKDGYIIQTTSSIEPVEVVENTSSVVETTSTLTELTSDEPLADNLSDGTQDEENVSEEEIEVLEEVFFEEEEEVSVKYDLKEMRRTASFDPHTLKLKSSNGIIVGNYEVCRDLENRNLIISQDDRDDFIVINVDVDTDELSDKFKKIANEAVKEFDEAPNHKDGSRWVIKALVSCTNKCHHTDDFAGFVEECVNSNCPVQIWKKSSYVSS